jgi:hypothetical protein
MSSHNESFNPLNFEGIRNQRGTLATVFLDIMEEYEKKVAELG